MAKSKSKSKKDKKPANDKLEALKLFTKSTSIDVSDLMKHKTFEEVVQQIYIPINNNNLSANLLKRYEKQLLLCKLDYDRFRSGLHTFYTDTHKYIKENKLFNDFYNIVLYINIEISKKEDFDVDIKSAYLSLLIQQTAYFKGVDNNVYGVTSTGDLLYQPEPIKNYYKISYETSRVMNSTGGIQEILKILSRYGYPNMNPQKALTMAGIDKAINGSCFQMAGLINEENESKIFPKKFADLSYDYKYNSFLVSTKRDNVLLNLLKKRNKLLPSGGVEAEIRNCGDVVKVFLLEQFKNDTTILLFKVTYIDGGSIFGFFIPQDSGYYDTWLSSIDVNDNCNRLALCTRTTIYQLYADLTVNFEDKGLKNSVVLFNTRLFDNDEKISSLMPKVKYLIHHDYRVVTPHNRDFVRQNYDTALAQVQPFLRKLPMGASPSEEARALAEKLGIDLPIGYTVVKEFKKKVYVNKK